MKEKKIMRILMFFVKLALVISWMMIIFYFSSEVGYDSKDTSTGTIKYILNIIFGGSNEELIITIEPIIRKLAHFSLYALGGIIIFEFVNSIYKHINDDKNMLKVSLITLAIGIIYAISDEIHQSFVPDRGPKITDVLIDVSGIIFGIILVIILRKSFKYINRNIRKE